MTTEETGDGIAQEHETQTEDVQEGRNVSEGADEGDGDGDTSEPEPKEAGKEGDGGDDDPEPEPDNKPKSPEARRRARDRERIESLQDQVKTLQDRRERILKAGEQDVAPKLDDFDNDIEYAAAKAVFDASKRQSDRELKELDDQASDFNQRIAREREQAFSEQVAEARTRIKDYDKVIQHLPSALGGNEAMAEAIMDSDRGADVAYYLSSNPARAREIAAMNLPQMWKAIGALESRLSQPRSAPKRAVPEPVEPVRGGGGGNKPTPYTAGSTAEYMRMMDKKERSSAS